MDPHEIIPEELQERAEGHTDRNGTQPDAAVFSEPVTPADVDADMKLALATLARMDLRIQSAQAMLTILIVATVVLAVEFELVRRGGRDG